MRLICFSRIFIFYASKPIINAPAFKQPLLEFLFEFTVVAHRTLKGFGACCCHPARASPRWPVLQLTVSTGLGLDRNAPKRSFFFSTLHPYLPIHQPCEPHPFPQAISLPSRMLHKQPACLSPAYSGLLNVKPD